VLRTALRRMLAVPRLSDDARATLGHLDGLLVGVTVLGAGQFVPEWRESRRNARYVPALRLAELVLARTSAAAGRPGRYSMASFAVDMAVVFEQFVETALREALAPYPGGTVGQYPAGLDEPDSGPASALAMRVDVVHVVRGAPVLVFDSKYKAANERGEYPNADHYQMLAYCTALDVPVAWLVYAGAGTPRAPHRQHRCDDHRAHPRPGAAARSPAAERRHPRCPRLGGRRWGGRCPDDPQQPAHPGGAQRHQASCRPPPGQGEQEFVIMARNGTSRARVFVLVRGLRRPDRDGSVTAEETDPRDRRTGPRSSRSEHSFFG
jgi:hypothetical protein